MNCEVGIIGAGVSGLAAALELARAGREVCCLEAVGRAGGRILTIHDPLAPIPLELGAEFVHGRPEETWRLIRSAGLTAYEHTAKAPHLHRGRVVKNTEPGSAADRILSRIAHSKGADATFEQMLTRSRQPADVKAWAAVHVEGFNAARKDRISTNSLVKDSDAADKIEGDRTFRIVNGYDSIPLALLRSIPEYERRIRLNSIVERVEWRRGQAEVRYRDVLSGETRRLWCGKLVVTVPLGVLQAGAIGFDPEPTRNLRAARRLEFGQVYRVTLRFREPFWEDDERLRGAGFVISRDPGFFAWWTTHPVMSPILTGWMAGTAAERYRPADAAGAASEARRSLGRILQRDIPRPEAFYFHDWRQDPFFRGAYSYVPAGAMRARADLAKPVGDTLYFSGEATETEGHSATVHGAIAAGIRTARQILGE